MTSRFFVDNLTFSYRYFKVQRHTCDIAGSVIKKLQSDNKLKNKESACSTHYSSFGNLLVACISMSVVNLYSTILRSLSIALNTLTSGKQCYL